jgi:uncharacterized protein
LKGVKMLLRFAVSNYRSFDSEQELSMVASSLKGTESAAMEVPAAKMGALRVAAVYGPNASGKSNVLRALHFVCNAVEDSHVSWKPQQRIPRHSFKMRPERADEATNFRVDFVVGGTRYEYKFAVASESVISESLHSFPEARSRLIFRRSADSFTFGKFTAGPNQLIASLTRSNSLFLSAAAQNNHEMLLPVYNWFAQALRFVSGPRDEPNGDTFAICADASRKPLLERFLTAADFGLAGVDFKEREVPEETRRIFTAVAMAVPDAAEKIHFPERIIDVSFLHRCENGESVRFGPNDESTGTLAYFGLLGPVIETLEQGGVLCVDELEKSLHPLLALEIVRIFNDEERNPKGAQLIFNTHDTNLLDADVLRRDQVWFTEKDRCGATHLYPLTDFKPRREENLERGYLQGRYGAVPYLHREDFNAGLRRPVDHVADGE